MSFKSSFHKKVDRDNSYQFMKKGVMAIISLSISAPYIKSSCEKQI